MHFKFFKQLDMKDLIKLHTFQLRFRFLLI